MVAFKTDILRNYPGSEDICAFIRECNDNPHELRRCDGGLAVYRWWLRVVDMDKSIAKYKEDSWANYESAKQTMRRALRILKTYKTNKERYI